MADLAVPPAGYSHGVPAGHRHSSTSRDTVQGSNGRRRGDRASDAIIIVLVDII